MSSKIPIRYRSRSRCFSARTTRSETRLHEAITPDARQSSSWWEIPKQSIYRFRRADVAMYERDPRDRLEQANGARVVNLTTSFRSPAAGSRTRSTSSFSPPNDGERPTEARLEYVALDPFRVDLGRISPRSSRFPCTASRTGGTGSIYKRSVEASLPDADRGRSWTGWSTSPGWKVTERESTR